MRAVIPRLDRRGRSAPGNTGSGDCMDVHCARPRRWRWPAGAVVVCHAFRVSEQPWDPYDLMGVSFQQHAADSAYNAHYDRPAVLAALGPVAGRQVLDAACGPGLYVRELLERGAEVTAFDASPVMVSLAGEQTAGRVRIDQAALGEPLPY